MIMAGCRVTIRMDDEYTLTVAGDAASSILFDLVLEARYQWIAYIGT